MRWSWQHYRELSLDDLYDALALRGRVFILEQGPFLDPDGVDRRCWHLFGRDEANVLQAYLRAAEPGVVYAEPSLGRVVTSAELRGTGLGRSLMLEGIARCRSAWPGQGIRINAQARLRRFYAGLGFEAVGEEYIDDGIPHLQMFRAAP